jgi:hypothetical protein
MEDQKRPTSCFPWLKGLVEMLQRWEGKDGQLAWLRGNSKLSMKKSHSESRYATLFSKIMAQRIVPLMDQKSFINMRNKPSKVCENKKCPRRKKGYEGKKLKVCGNCGGVRYCVSFP